MVGYPEKKRNQAVAAYPRTLTWCAARHSRLTKGHPHGEISEIHPAEKGIHRFDQPGVGLDVTGASACLVKEIIERQRAMPRQGLAQRNEVFPYLWVIHPRPRGVSPAHTHPSRLRAVNCEEVAMFKDRLGLTQHTGRFFLHNDLVRSVE